MPYRRKKSKRGVGLLRPCANIPKLIEGFQGVMSQKDIKISAYGSLWDSESLWHCCTSYGSYLNVKSKKIVKTVEIKIGDLSNVMIGKSFVNKNII